MSGSLHSLTQILGLDVCMRCVGEQARQAKALSSCRCSPFRKQQHPTPRCNHAASLQNLQGHDMQRLALSCRCDTMALALRLCSALLPGPSLPAPAALEPPMARGPDMLLLSTVWKQVAGREATCTRVCKLQLSRVWAEIHKFLALCSLKLCLEGAAACACCACWQWLPLVTAASGNGWFICSDSGK